MNGAANALSLKPSMRSWAGLAVVLAILAGAGWLLDARALLASYLAAWWFVTGALLGGLANVWLHQLTGGAWGEAIRLARLAAGLPVVLAGAGRDVAAVSVECAARPAA